VPVASFAYLTTALKVVLACLHASLRTKFRKGSFPRQPLVARAQQLLWVHPSDRLEAWQPQATPCISEERASIHKQQPLWLVSSARVKGRVFPDWNAKHMSVFNIISPASGFGGPTSARTHCILPAELLADLQPTAMMLV